MNYSGNVPDWPQYNSTQPAINDISSASQNVNSSHLTYLSSASPTTLGGLNLNTEGLEKHQNDTNFNPRHFPNIANGADSSLAPIVQMQNCISHYGTATRNPMDTLNSPLDSRNNSMTTLNEELSYRNNQVPLNRTISHLNGPNINVNAPTTGVASRNSGVNSASNTRQGPPSYLPCKGLCCNPDANISYQQWEKYGHYQTNVSYRENMRAPVYPTENRRYGPDVSARKDNYENKDVMGSIVPNADHRRNYPDYSKYRKDPTFCRSFQPASGMLQNYPVQNYNYSMDYQKYPYAIKDYSKMGNMNVQNTGMLKHQDQTFMNQQKYNNKHVHQNNAVLNKGMPSTNVGPNVMPALQNSYYNPQFTRNMSGELSRECQETADARIPSSQIHGAPSQYQTYQQKIAMQRFTMENHLREFTRIPGYQSHPKYKECVHRYRELLKLQQPMGYQNVVQPTSRVPTPVNTAVAPINLQFDQNGMLINSSYLPDGFPRIQQGMNSGSSTGSCEKLDKEEVHNIPLSLQTSLQSSEAKDSTSTDTKDIQNQEQVAIQKGHEQDKYQVQNDKRLSPQGSDHSKASKEFADKPELDVRQFLANWDESEDEDGANSTALNVSSIVLNDSVPVVVVDYENVNLSTKTDNVNISKEVLPAEVNYGSQEKPQECLTISYPIETTASKSNNEQSSAENIIKPGGIIQCISNGPDEIPTIHIVDNLGMTNILAVTEGATKLLEQQETIEFFQEDSERVQQESLSKNDECSEQPEKFPSNIDPLNNDECIENSDRGRNDNSRDSTVEETAQNLNLRKQSSFTSEESHNPDDISLPDLPTSECTPISTTLNTPIHSDSEESSEHVEDLTISTNPIEIIPNSPMISFTHSPVKNEPYGQLQNGASDKEKSLEFNFNDGSERSNMSFNNFELSTNTSKSDILTNKNKEHHGSTNEKNFSSSDNHVCSYNSKNTNNKKSNSDSARCSSKLVAEDSQIITNSSGSDNTDLNTHNSRTEEDVDSCSKDLNLDIAQEGPERIVEESGKVNNENDNSKNPSLKKISHTHAKDSKQTKSKSSSQPSQKRIYKIDSGSKFVVQSRPKDAKNEVTKVLRKLDTKCEDMSQLGDCLNNLDWNASNGKERMKSLKEYRKVKHSVSIKNEDKTKNSEIVPVSVLPNTEKVWQTRLPEQSLTFAKNTVCLQQDPTINVSSVDSLESDATAEQEKRPSFSKSFVTKNVNTDFEIQVTNVNLKIKDNNDICKQLLTVREKRQENVDAIKIEINLSCGDNVSKKHDHEGSNGFTDNMDVSSVQCEETEKAKETEGEKSFNQKRSNNVNSDNLLSLKNDHNDVMSSKASNDSDRSVIEIPKMKHSGISKEITVKDSGSKTISCNKSEQDTQETNEIEQASASSAQLKDAALTSDPESTIVANPGNRITDNSQSETIKHAENNVIKDSETETANQTLFRKQADLADKQKCEGKGVISIQQTNKRQESTSNAVSQTEMKLRNASCESSLNLDFDHFDIAPNEKIRDDREKSKNSRMDCHFNDFDIYKGISGYVNPVFSNIDEIENLNNVPVFTTKDGKITYSPNPRYTYRALILEARKKEGHSTLRDIDCSGTCIKSYYPKVHKWLKKTHNQTFGKRRTDETESISRRSNNHENIFKYCSKKQNVHLEYFNDGADREFSKNEDEEIPIFDNKQLDFPSEKEYDKCTLFNIMQHKNTIEDDLDYIRRNRRSVIVDPDLLVVAKKSCSDDPTISSSNYEKENASNMKECSSSNAPSTYRTEEINLDHVSKNQLLRQIGESFVHDSAGFCLSERIKYDELQNKHHQDGSRFENISTDVVSVQKFQEDSEEGKHTDEVHPSHNQQSNIVFNDKELTTNVLTQKDYRIDGSIFQGKANLVAEKRMQNRKLSTPNHISCTKQSTSDMQCIYVEESHSEVECATSIGTSQSVTETRSHDISDNDNNNEKFGSVSVLQCAEDKKLDQFEESKIVGTNKKYGDSIQILQQDTVQKAVIDLKTQNEDSFNDFNNATNKMVSSLVIKRVEDVTVNKIILNESECTIIKSPDVSQNFVEQENQENGTESNNNCKGTPENKTSETSVGEDTDKTLYENAVTQNKVVPNSEETADDSCCRNEDNNSSTVAAEEIRDFECPGNCENKKTDQLKSPQEEEKVFVHEKINDKTEVFVDNTHEVSDIEKHSETSAPNEDLSNKDDTSNNDDGSFVNEAAKFSIEPKEQENQSNTNNEIIDLENVPELSPNKELHENSDEELPTLTKFDDNANLFDTKTDIINGNVQIDSAEKDEFSLPLKKLENVTVAGSDKIDTSTSLCKMSQYDDEKRISENISPPILVCEATKVVPKIVIKKIEMTSKIVPKQGASANNIDKETEPKRSNVELKLGSHPKIPKMIIRNATSQPGTSIVEEIPQFKVENKSCDKQEKDTEEDDTKLYKNNVLKMKIKLDGKPKKITKNETVDTYCKRKDVKKGIQKLKIKKIKMDFHQIKESSRYSSDDSDVEMRVQCRDNEDLHNSETDEAKRTREKFPKIKLRKQDMEKCSEVNTKRQEVTCAEASRRRTISNNTEIPTKRSKKSEKEERNNSVRTRRNLHHISEKVPKVIIKRSSASSEFKCELSKDGKDAIVKSAKWQPEVKLQRCEMLDLMVKDLKNSGLTLNHKYVKNLSSTCACKLRAETCYKSNNERSNILSRSCSTSDLFPMKCKERRMSDYDYRKFLPDLEDAVNVNGKENTINKIAYEANNVRHTKHTNVLNTETQNEESKKVNNERHETVHLDDTRKSKCLDIGPFMGFANKLEDSQVKRNSERVSDISVTNEPSVNRREEEFIYTSLLNNNDNAVEKEECSIASDTEDLTMENDTKLLEFEAGNNTVIKLDSSDDSQTTIEILPASPDVNQNGTRTSDFEECESTRVYLEDAIPTQFELELEITDSSNIDSTDVPMPKITEMKSYNPDLMSIERYDSTQKTKVLSNQDHVQKQEKSVPSHSTTSNIKWKGEQDLCRKEKATDENFWHNDSLIREVLAAKETLKRFLAKEQEIKVEDYKTKKGRHKTAAEKKQGSSFDHNADIMSQSNDDASQEDFDFGANILSKTECKSNIDKSEKKHSKQVKGSLIKNRVKPNSCSNSVLISEKNFSTISLKASKRVSEATSYKSETNNVENNTSLVADQIQSTTVKPRNSNGSQNQSSAGENREEVKVKEDNMPILEPEVALNFGSSSDRDSSRSPPVITNQESTDMGDLKIEQMESIVPDEKLEKSKEEADRKCELTLSDIVSQLAYHEKATIKHRRYCTLCEKWFPTTSRHRRHLAGYQHRHIELTQRRTIHALFMLFTGKPCPRLLPANVVRSECCIGESTPLQIAVQDVTNGVKHTERHPKANDIEK